ncbi:hypothetical protein V3C99_018941 [Haemonchus contortus]
MLCLFLLLLIPCVAQNLDTTKQTPPQQRPPQSNVQSQVPSQQAFTPRVPDVVVSSNGESEFNFGPLTLPAPTLTNQLNVREKHASKQSTSALRNNFSGKKHNGGRTTHSGQSQAPRVNNRQQNVGRNGLNLQAPAIGVPPGGHPTPRQPFDEEFEYEEDFHSGGEGGFRTGNRPFRDPALPIHNFASGAHIQTHRSYVYPEKNYPLRECFYNPSGYACCNRTLNDEIVRTFEHLVAEPGFNLCNTQKIANALQTNAARRFKVQFEAIVGLADYAQRVNFGGDLVCKVELAGRYMLVYATPTRGSNRVKRDLSSTVVVDESTMAL